jgi:hypothetical protein
MLRNKLFTLMSLVIAVGCEQSATAPRSTGGPAVTTPAPTVPQQWRGRIEEGPTLRLDDGSQYRLGGDQCLLLSSLQGADVSIQGSNDLDQGIIVSSFLVLAVGGTAVNDGVLERSDSGYSLRLSADGSMLPLASVPDELVQYVGERLWVHTNDDGTTIFGVINGTS